MNIKELKSAISDGAYNKAFFELYGADCDIEAVKARYLSCAEGFENTYSNKQYGNVRLFSVAGRSEISGNHTDHNHGKVLAGSISLDIISVAATNDDNTVAIKSEGFPEDVVSLCDVEKVRDNEKYKASAIIRGVCDGFTKNGYNIGGYYAYTTSNVLKGSGLSSSAAFEDMVGNMLSHFYNNGDIDNVEIAKISQYAENVHFGKPCGLMDQVACAVGGFVAIDFKDPKNPMVEKLPFDLEKHGLRLCIVNTGGNHADLNEDYASVPGDMKRVAEFLGVKFLRESSKEKLIEKAKEIREQLSDKCFMRALHFFNENERVSAQKKALAEGDLNAFLSGVKASGISSFTMLQNVYTTKNVDEQRLSLALALSAEVLKCCKNAAWRVHGGGFAGTIQSFVPAEKTEEYKNLLESVFGQGSVYILKVRKYGAVCLDKLN
ncbi:MAG: galactokinase [Clostridia bacterium]|nr:galactokinase [Clostridia bacterium]